MNTKLWTATSVTLSIMVAVGCSTPPPTNLTINTQSGSGGGATVGTGGSETSAETTDVSTGVGGNPGSQAKEYYLSIVDSELNGTCASCHASGQNGAPIFMGANPNASYNALDQHGGLVVAPENSLLVLHGAHTGPALTAATKADVLTWLTMEAEERGLATGGGGTGGADGGAPTATTLKQALDEYGACMDITDWTDNGLDTLYNAQTLNYGPCGGCHQSGDGGNWLSSNKQETFDENGKFPYIKRQITGTVDGDGNFKDLIAANRFIQKGAEPCMPNTNCHPAYVLPPNLKTGIDTFVQKTIDKWHNKQCAPKP